jgi:hypothetical protein
MRPATHKLGTSEGVNRLKRVSRTPHRRSPADRQVVALWALVLAGASGAGAQVVVGAGSTVGLGTGALVQGCADLVVAGTLRLDQGQLSGVDSIAVTAGGQLDGGAGSLSWSGGWTDLGAFLPGTSSAVWADGCGVMTATANAANEQFYALSLLTATGRVIRFTSGQSTSIAAALTLTGTAGNRLRIRSTLPAEQAFLDLMPGATQSLYAVDVADNHAIGQLLGPGPAASYASIKGANSQGWFELAATEVPVASTAGLVLLTLGLALAASAVLRRSRANTGGASGRHA